MPEEIEIKLEDRYPATMRAVLAGFDKIGMAPEVHAIMNILPNKHTYRPSTVAFTKLHDYAATEGMCMEHDKFLCRPITDIFCVQCTLTIFTNQDLFFVCKDCESLHRHRLR